MVVGLYISEKHVHEPLPACVSVPHAHSGPQEVRKGVPAPGAGLPGSCETWVLEGDPCFSRREVSARNYWTTFQPPFIPHYFFFKDLKLLQVVTFSLLFLAHSYSLLVYFFLCVLGVFVCVDGCVPVCSTHVWRVPRLRSDVLLDHSVLYTEADALPWTQSSLIWPG